jgi:hypothetical protein
MKPEHEIALSRRALLQSAVAVTALTTMTKIASAQNAAPENLLFGLRAGHPRLVASANSWVQIKARRAQDALLDGFLKRSEAEARALLDAPPMAYKKDGKRLLHVSRAVLRRVLLLATQFRLTGDEVFARRAEAEMQNVAAFGDWNPSHFLDVAEMTAALALCYDWLFDWLSDASRQSLRAAIIDKGLKPGLADKGFQNTRNNWNSVCLCGIALGALAIAEDEPDLARQVLAKVKQFNINGLQPYAPEGVYPEGAVYWGYGTTFEVLLLDSLRTALGTDWGLGKSAGFMESAPALLQQLGPTGAFFNFSDGSERIGSEPAMWWFARALKQPSLLFNDKARLQSYANSAKLSDVTTEDDRLLPLAALWWPEANAAGANKPLPLNWLGRGAQSLASFRSSWDDRKAMFLALKGGGASLSHGHMDAGSFVFEAAGVRWARDLGAQDYLSLESKGIDLWNSKQDGGRWKVFRLSPFSHSTLTLNGQLHRADGLARISHFSDSGDAGAIVDLSPIFAGQASRVTRGFAFRANHVLIRDELEGLKEGDSVRWAMLTRAEISISADGSQATLSESGQQLSAILQAAPGAKFESIAADPPNDYDAPNKGFRLLIANFKAPASGKIAATVTLQVLAAPTGIIEDRLEGVELSKWAMAAVK